MYLSKIPRKRSEMGHNKENRLNWFQLEADNRWDIRLGHLLEWHELTSTHALKHETLSKILSFPRDLFDREEELFELEFKEDVEGYGEWVWVFS